MLSGGASQSGSLEVDKHRKKDRLRIGFSKSRPRFRSEHISKLAIVHKNVVIMPTAAQTFDQLCAFRQKPRQKWHEHKGMRVPVDVRRTGQ